MVTIINKSGFYVRCSNVNYADFDAVFNISRIITKVSEISKLSVNSLIGSNRKREITEWRHLICYICRYNGYGTLTQIAWQLGKRHHSTIIFGYEKTSDLLNSNDKFFMMKYNQIKHLLV